MQQGKFRPDRLDGARRRRGWSIETLATKTARPYSSTYAWTTGRRVPKMEAALVLADALEIDVRDLFEPIAPDPDAGRAYLDSRGIGEADDAALDRAAAVLVAGDQDSRAG